MEFSLMQWEKVNGSDSTLSVGGYYHVTLLSNLIKGYDKYSGRYSKGQISQSRYPNYFFVLPKDQLHIGLEKTESLLEKNALYGDEAIIIKTCIPPEAVQANTVTGTGLGLYVDRNWIKLDSIYTHVDGELIEQGLEELIARSFQLNNSTHINYSQCAPRSVSLLPVAQGCQATCPFCFSHASISTEQTANKNFIQNVDSILQIAKKSGAERAVITGGGEPGMLKMEFLCQLIRSAKKYFDKVVLITNGYFLIGENTQEKLQALHDEGLSVLSVSRHHYNGDVNQQIMNLSVDAEHIARSVNKMGDLIPNLSLRWICVLQKGGVATEQDVGKYINWADSLGVTQVCFKELYVSSSSESIYHSNESNLWSQRHQVPLSLITDYCKQKSMKEVHSLPWGSPIYRHQTETGYVDIAAYTEPSVYWELSNKLCRSWNLMANGECYASLETKDSQVKLGL